MVSVRYVAIGDSFTEGLGDGPQESPRGWADLVAQGWADASGEAIEYANLAIRGKLIRPIVDEQLEAALALKPTHLSFNGGGNDMLRPKTSVADVVASFDRVLQRCDEEGVQLIMLSGANPAQIPLSAVFQRRGDALSAAVLAHLADRPDVVQALNWPDRELMGPGYWSDDRLHMNVRGHHRVAARVLTALGFEPPAAWWSLPPLEGGATISAASYFREYLGPWLMRRLTGTSSGDDRTAKHPEWTRIEPHAAEVTPTA